MKTRNINFVAAFLVALFHVGEKTADSRFFTHDIRTGSRIRRGNRNRNGFGNSPGTKFLKSVLKAQNDWRNVKRLRKWNAPENKERILAHGRMTIANERRAMRKQVMGAA